METKKKLIVLCGPTGIGKTAVSIELARVLHAEIISADSRQLFKEMKIGTAVPSEDELAAVPHHFIQSHSVFNYYNASMYELEVMEFLNEYFHHKSTAMLVGGSGMYIDAVCRGIDDIPTIKPEIRAKWKLIYEERGLEYLQRELKACDPEYYNRVDLQNYKRILKGLEVFDQSQKPYSGFLKNSAKERPFTIQKLGLNTEREILYDRINLRVDKMVAEGMVEEARKLYPHRNIQPLNTVGYKELFAHFDGTLTLDEAITQIKNHSRAYARRQITWFRRDESIKWFTPNQIPAMLDWIQSEA